MLQCAENARAERLVVQGGRSFPNAVDQIIPVILPFVYVRLSGYSATEEKKRGKVDLASFWSPAGRKVNSRYRRSASSPIAGAVNAG